MCRPFYVGAGAAYGSVFFQSGSFSLHTKGGRCSSLDLFSKDSIINFQDSTWLSVANYGPLASWLVLLSKAGHISLWLPCREKFQERQMPVSLYYQYRETILGEGNHCWSLHPLQKEIIHSNYSFKGEVEGEDWIPLKNLHLYWEFIMDSHELTKDVAGQWDPVNSNWECHRAQNIQERSSGKGRIWARPGSLYLGKEEENHQGLQLSGI